MKSIFLRKSIVAAFSFFCSLAISLCYAQSVNVNRQVYPIQSRTIKVAKTKPFFPLGFYHVSHRLNSQQRMAALRDIAAAGFNVIHAGCSNLDDYNQFLDEAERLGVYVITEFNDVDYRLVVKKFKNKPAVLAWNIADDAGDHQTRNEILDMHQQIKAIAPHQYTYISISGWSRKWPEFADVGDLIGGQSYPIGNTLTNQPQGLPNKLIAVNHIFNIARTESKKYNRPFIANLQTFKWKNQRSPTSREVYNMTYQSILAGAKGILFFPYDDGENLIRNDDPLWKRLRSLPPEINQLSPVLINGGVTKLNTNNAQLLAGQWKYQGNYYIIIVNTSSSQAIKTSIAFPSKSRSLHSLFPGHPSGMVLRNGRLRGSIQPEDVHIYRIAQ
jgi:hypothetical protein